jgi:hypothetical protein
MLETCFLGPFYMILLSGVVFLSLSYLPCNACIEFLLIEFLLGWAREKWMKVTVKEWTKIAVMRKMRNLLF